MRQPTEGPPPFSMPKKKFEVSSLPSSTQHEIGDDRLSTSDTSDRESEFPGLFVAYSFHLGQPYVASAFHIRLASC